MLAVGVVEIAAGAVVALRPRFGGYLVAAWLAGVIENPLLQADRYDIALRDFGLVVAALALARLASTFDPAPTERWAGPRQLPTAERSPGRRWPSSIDPMSSKEATHEPRPSLLIIGVSLAGAKAAEGARAAGFTGRVVLIGEEADLPDERPPLCEAVLRGEAAPGTAQVHERSSYAARDIELLTGRTVEELDVDASTVRLDGGDRLPCTAVAPGVYAASDVASAHHPHHREHVRVEHCYNAQHQGVIAGGNAAGTRERYAELPYSFSDQHDLGMEYVGRGQPGDTARAWEPGRSRLQRLLAPSRHGHRRR